MEIANSVTRLQWGECMERLISVIVPVYNVEKYLRQCIESILAQTYKDMEIILIDDGSTDSCGQTCDEYALADKRIVVVHRANKGLVSARKEGLRLSHGEYITYVDGDDWIDTNAYEKMMARISEDGTDMAVYGHFENTGNSQKVFYHKVDDKKYNKNNLMKDVYPSMIAGESFFDWQVFPSVWDMLLRKELLEKAQYDVCDDIDMGEDAACKYPCLLMADSVSFVHEAYYHYRQNQGSMIKTAKAPEVEKRKLRLLYSSVLERLEKLDEGYNLKRQWQSYMLSLMIPRADGLVENMREAEYLFPYREISRNARIAIYGAGTYGQRLYKFIKETGFCQVVAWFDMNYEYLNSLGLEVRSPETIADIDCDGVLIANMSANSRKAIREFILSKKKCAIYEIDEGFIFSKECLSKLGIDNC